MIIRHNMTAMNAARELKINARKKAATTEKLSSGYKINRAADGSAELAMSEKMRKLIRGLGQDHDNITEGISVCQIADGALDEVVGIMQRMRELTIKAYNGTNSLDDKLACQQEVDQMLLELDRIRSTVKYNEQYLLQGDPSYKYTQVTHIPSNTVVEKVTFNYEAKGFPAWIPYDKKLTLDNAKVGTDNKQITEDKVAIIKMGQPDEKIYGNFEGSDGEWTDTMKDNYASVMDFSAISRATSPGEIVDKLKELSGSGFTVTCSTCNLEYAIYFTSDDDVGKEDTVTGVRGFAKVDLSDLISKAGG